jgi:Mg-chelatase subunit ChlD
MSKARYFVQTSNRDYSCLLTLLLPIAVATMVGLAALGSTSVSARALEVIGPPDDPYVPTHTMDKLSAARSMLEPLAPSGAMSSSLTDSLRITTIDASNWPEICVLAEFLDENGQSISDLEADSCCVRHDQTDIESFSITEVQDNRATSICLVIDVSSSMYFDGKLDSVKIAANEFVDQMGALDRLAIVTFSTCFQVLQNFTSDKALLRSKIDVLTGGGATAVFDAIWKGVDLTSAEIGTKAVIALSDGMENRSWECDGPPDGIYSDDWTNDSTLIVGLAQTVGVPIYTISIGDTFDPYYLQGFAFGSRGDYYQALTAGELSTIFSDIKNRLRSGYLICYTSPDTILDGSCHDVLLCRKDEYGSCAHCDEAMWCEPFPPTITVDPLLCQPWEQDVQVCAVVNDPDTPIEELLVRLFFRISSVEPFTEVTMAYSGGLFCAIVPGDLLSCGGEDIQYYITAYDGMSSAASPSAGPNAPYTIPICANSAPICNVPSDQTIVLCDPEEVCFPFSADDPDSNLVGCELSYNGSTISIPSSGYQWCYTPEDSDVIDVTLRCIDACGLGCEQTTQLSFVIDQPPIITCPQDMTFECGSVGGFGVPAVQDENPSTVTLSVSQDSTAAQCDHEYTLVRTWTATDECGKTTECTQTVIVVDTTPPLLTCPDPLTVACASEIPDPDVSAVVASDACGGVITVTHEGDSPLTNGVLTRTYRATDICGNYSECTQIIDVDSTASLAITCPAAVTVACPAEVPLADVDAVIVTGDCDGTATVTHVGDVSDSLTCSETITRTYRATDASGDTAECTQTITIGDGMPLSIQCHGDTTITVAPSASGAVVEFSVIVGESCSAVSVDCDPPSGSFFPIGNVTVTCTAADACATASCTFIVTVRPSTQPPLTRVSLDIKPQSCPNPLNVKLKDGNPNSSAGPQAELSGNAVLPAAVLGTATFDVTTIDPASLSLKGIPPLRWNLEDVATPIIDGEDCECLADGADGFADLIVKFSKDDVIAAIGPVSEGDEVVLPLTGMLLDGTDIVGTDCVVVRGMRSGYSKALSPAEGADGDIVTWSHPNPFNNETLITFDLGQAGRVDIDIYDILGRRVITLLSDFQSAGRHSVAWNGRSSSGTEVASGVYFYRISTGNSAVTRKMVLLK